MSAARSAQQTLLVYSSRPTGEAVATIQALEQVLHLDEGSADQRCASACQEALEHVVNTFHIENNAGWVQWAEQRVASVKSEEDMADFLDYFQATVRQYAAACLLTQLEDRVLYLKVQRKVSETRSTGIFPAS